MKKVLITGSAGFIGFHLASALKKQGHVVIGYDNFNSYYDPRLKRRRAEKLDELKIPLIEGDICEKDFFLHLLKKYEITHVVHLAAQAGVRHSLTHPEEYVKSNLHGFQAVLEACSKIPGIRFVYASSSSVYGKNTKVPFSELDLTDQPGNFYGATKKSGELMATSYHHLFGMPVIGLRFFTVYGPWGRPDMAYYHFANLIKEGKPIQVFNHGQMKRDFTYIDDIVAGTIAALDLKQNLEVINLGGNRPMPLLSLIQLLEKGLNKTAKLEMLPMQPGEAVETYADISKAQKLLGFQPKTSLEEGIDKFLSWYLQNI